MVAVAARRFGPFDKLFSNINFRLFRHLLSLLERKRERVKIKIKNFSLFMHIFVLREILVRALFLEYLIELR